MYPDNIYEKVTREDCATISIDEFKEVLTHVQKEKLTNVEQFILTKLFREDCNASYAMYQLGYQRVGQVYNKIKRIVRILREEINFMYCTENDLVSLFVGMPIVSKAKLQDCTIKEAMDMYSSISYIYKNQYDQLISYTILKRFKYTPDLRQMKSIKETFPEISAYWYIVHPKYDSGCNGIKNLQYSFIRNIHEAIKKVYAYDSNHAGIIDSIMYLEPQTYRQKSKMLRRIQNDYFIKLVYDINSMYTEWYFDCKSMKEVRLDSLLSLSDELIDKCNLIIDEISLSKHNVFSFVYAVICQRYNKSDIFTDDDIKCMEETVEEIRSKNPFMASEINDLERFIRTTRLTKTYLRD